MSGCVNGGRGVGVYVGGDLGSGVVGSNKFSKFAMKRIV